MKIYLMNLFEMFDPMINNYLSMNWLFMILPSIFVYPNMFYLIPSRMIIIWFKILNLMFKEFKMIYKIFSNIFIFLTLMIYIFMLNLISLIPYIFNLTSHLIFNLSMSLSLWLSLIIYIMINFYKKFFIHLVPLNSPLYLMNFMVMIELISILIRPLTLSIRLCANLISGHLILMLLSNFLMNYMNLILISGMIQNILMILEIFMSFIQAYVFAMLMILYYSEY